jgi:single-strand DNA-binding protein
VVNKLIYQGRLVADPELKRTQSDVSNMEFTIAWSEKYKEAETKCFLRCKAWRNTAEFIDKYFKKGQEIIIEGHMVTEQWEDGEEKKSRTICVVDKAHFCGSKADSVPIGANQSSPIPGTDGFENIPDGIDEELPFS